MSTHLDPDTVRKVAHLARLELADDRLAHFADQLAAVLAYMEQLGELDTAGVEPTAHAMPLSNVWRDDVPGESLSAAQALANAPGSQINHFQVPKVLDQQTP